MKQQPSDDYVSTVEAIRIAQGKISNKKVTFASLKTRALPYESNSFDIGHLRGVLHHMENPQESLREALRVSRSLVVIEPNGYNLIVKILEKISPYHIKHKEKSYAPSTLKRWVDQSGGKIIKESFMGLVPFFCWSPLARLLKKIEPVIERIPFLARCICGCYIFLVVRREDEG